MEYEIEECRPAKLSISLHEISNQSYELEKEKENFVPKPILCGKGSFDIDPEIYEFKYDFLCRVEILF